MITVIGTPKGGAGKSTISVNLAVTMAHQGLDVLLVDADRQQTSSKFAAERIAQQRENPKREGEPKFGCVSVYGEQLMHELRSQAGRYDEVLVDVGGRDTEDLRYSLLAATRVIAPFLPSPPDAWELEGMLKIIKEVRPVNPYLECYLLVNQADTNVRMKMVNEFTDFISDPDFELFELLKTKVYSRTAYRKCMRDGLGVKELTGRDKDHKAIMEMFSLYSELYEEVYDEESA